jgi:serine/threonine-protein kinase
VTDTLAHRLREALGPDYSVERELGGGGMSRVFVATEQALGRRVVVKVLPPDLAAGVNIERFRREIQLAAQLQHPLVVPLLTAGERDGLLWFTMPFIEGESLRATLDRRERLPVREVIGIVRDVLDALAYAHSRGVVHRDIKPGNILMSGAHAVVTDFGVAKALSAAIPLAGHTTSGMAIGTPAYMAPEQLAADPDADHRVDLYGVGLLAYELLTGRSPFSGKSPQATLAAQLTVRPTPPHITRAEVPAPLSALIMHCLEKDADKRPATAAEALRALDQAEQELSGAVAAASLVRTRRSLLAAAVLFVAATAVFAMSRRNAPSSSARGGDSVAAVAETVVVYRPVPVGQDVPEGVTLPLVLAPAESSALDRDSLIAAVSRLFADSMARAIARMEEALATQPRQMELRALASSLGAANAANAAASTSPSAAGSAPAAVAATAADSARLRAARDSARRVSRGFMPPPEFVAPRLPPPQDGRRRIAIAPVMDRTRDSANAALVASLTDGLERAVRGVRGRLEVLPADQVARIIGSEGMHPTSAGFALRADVVVSSTLFVRNDSVQLLTVVSDTRDGDQTRFHREVLPVGTDMNSAIPSTLRWVRARLDSMRVGVPRRTPGTSDGPAPPERGPREFGPPPGGMMEGGVPRDSAGVSRLRGGARRGSGGG